MENLPDEVILDILNHTPDPEIIRLCQSNSRFRQLCSDSSLWINKIPFIYFKPDYLNWYQFAQNLNKVDLNEIITCNADDNEIIFLPSGTYYIIGSSRYNNRVLKIGDLYREEDEIPIFQNLPHESSIDKLNYSLYSSQLKHLIIDYCSREGNCTITSVSLEAAIGILMNVYYPNDTLEGQFELKDLLDDLRLIQ